MKLPTSEIMFKGLNRILRVCENVQKVLKTSKYIVSLVGMMTLVLVCVQSCA